MKKAIKAFLLVLLGTTTVTAYGIWWYNGLKDMESNPGGITPEIPHTESSPYQNLWTDSIQPDNDQPYDAYSYESHTDMKINSLDLVLDFSDSELYYTGMQKTSPIAGDSFTQYPITQYFVMGTDAFRIPAAQLIKVGKLQLLNEGESTVIRTVVSIPQRISPEKMGFRVFASEWMNKISLQGTYSVTARLKFRELKEGDGVKILSLHIGRSPLSVSACTLLLRRYLPDMSVTEDGYILLKPMRIVNPRNGKTLYEITDLDIDNRKLKLVIK